jgi:hypothetical protein
MLLALTKYKDELRLVTSACEPVISCVKVSKYSSLSLSPSPAVRGFDDANTNSLGDIVGRLKEYVCILLLLVYMCCCLDPLYNSNRSMRSIPGWNETKQADSSSLATYSASDNLLSAVLR